MVVRRRITLPAVAVGMAAAVHLLRRSDELPHHLHPGHRLAIASGLVILAGAPHFVQLNPSKARWLPIAALLSAVATWTAVPETSAVLVIGGAVAGLAGLALVARSPSAWPAGAALAISVLVSGLYGAAPSDLRRAGAAACLGLFLWWPFGQLARWTLGLVIDLPGIEPGWWLLAVHGVLALLAARWVGVAADATRDAPRPHRCRRHGRSCAVPTTGHNGAMMRRQLGQLVKAASVAYDVARPTGAGLAC